MRILVTGGAGFIGSHVVDRYLAAGHQVAIVDNLATGRRENLNPRARFYCYDICDIEGMEHVFVEEHPEILSHHAAQMDIRRSLRDPLFDARVNVLGSLNLLELSVRHQVKRFIFASSGGAIYGEPTDVPVQEACATDPLSHYGVTKLSVERYLSVYKRLYGLTYVALRYANVYGPRQNPEGEAGVVAIFALQMFHGKTPTIYGDGSKTRDYVYVDDVVEANVRALEQGDCETLNLGCGSSISDYDIFEAVRRCVGYSGTPHYAPRRPGEVEHIALDVGRARAVFGWQPSIKLEEGIARTLAYIRCSKGAPQNREFARQQ